MTGLRLVADVGGTNVRFAIADAHGRLDRAKIYQGTDFPTFPDALSAYLLDANGVEGVSACAIAAAGPVVEAGVVKLTNNDWTVDRDQVSAALNGVPVALVNDLEAVAAALPHLTSDDLSPMVAPAPVRPELRTMLAVNVGTGFGAAAAIFRDGRWYTCPSEAGHMTLGRIEASDALPADASVESILSGSGLARLHERLAGRDAGAMSPPAASVLTESRRDAVAKRTVELFGSILGRVAGDLTLATCAWGGVYLCGSVATAWAATANAEQFRAEFIRKGPMQQRLEQVPVAVIRRDSVSLFGLAMMPLGR